jgi:hypothetical protein
MIVCRTLSLLWYYFPKYGGVHWFTGPVSNIGFPQGNQSRDSEEHGGEIKGDVDIHVRAVGGH